MKNAVMIYINHNNETIYDILTKFSLEEQHTYLLELIKDGVTDKMFSYFSFIDTNIELIDVENGPTTGYYLVSAESGASKIRINDTYVKEFNDVPEDLKIYFDIDNKSISLNGNPIQLNDSFFNDVKISREFIK
jgi:hypothetical protein